MYYPVYTIDTYISYDENKVDKNSFSRETTINVKDLKALSSTFGLPCVENTDSLTVVGEKQLLIFGKISTHMFYNSEDTQCRLIEIY